MDAREFHPRGEPMMPWNIFSFPLVWVCALTLSMGVAVAGPAKLGVYKGAGCDGLKGLETFTAWLGYKPEQTLEFISWQVLSAGTTWGLGCWRDGGQKHVVYSLPMLPDDGSAVLADGAAGKFDELFRRYAAKLVQFGYGHATVRIGWEFNGEWYPWAASKDPKSYIEYWRRIVTTMRSVPGADFKFDWCMAGGWTNFLPEEAYPGDAYVDYIGMDFYNVSVDRNAVTPEQRWDSRMNTRRGLKWHRDFASLHRKPMSYPEWGTGLKPDGSGGGDDPYFIEQMARWIADNNVAYHNYWDQRTGVNARLSDNHQPLAGAAYKRVFSTTTPKSPTLDET
jgi:hypothetical protein